MWRCLRRINRRRGRVKLNPCVDISVVCYIAVAIMESALSGEWMAGTELILWRRVYRSLRLLCCVVVLLTAAGAAMASEYHGTVSFNGLPVPGATVTVTQSGKKLVTVTD